MRFVVNWSETVLHSSAVEITLDDLAAWAIESSTLRALVGGKSRSPEKAQLAITLQRNPHLRARLLQLFVAQSDVSASATSVHSTHPVTTTGSPDSEL